MERKFKKIYLILIVFFIFIIMFFLILLFSYNSIFTLKNIEISKDFDFNNEKIINFLELYPLKLIWTYDKNILFGRLSKLYYLENYKIDIIYPNTIRLELKIRKPVSRIVGSNGKILVIDKFGVIFRLADENDNIPVLIYKKRNNINLGIKFKDKYLNLLEVLNNIKDNYEDIYSSISQIDIFNDDFVFDYSISYKTLQQRLYLKNQINVDSLRRGLACVLILEKRGLNTDILRASDNMFIYAP